MVYHYLFCRIELPMLAIEIAFITYVQQIDSLHPPLLDWLASKPRSLLCPLLDALMPTGYPNPPAPW
jgi:hypothetical protein